MAARRQQNQVLGNLFASMGIQQPAPITLGSSSTTRVATATSIPSTHRLTRAFPSQPTAAAALSSPGSVPTKSTVRTGSEDDPRGRCVENDSAPVSPSSAPASQPDPVHPFTSTSNGSNGSILGTQCAQESVGLPPTAPVSDAQAPVQAREAGPSHPLTTASKCFGATFASTQPTVPSSANHPTAQVTPKRGSPSATSTPVPTSTHFPTSTATQPANNAADPFSAFASAPQPSQPPQTSQYEPFQAPRLAQFHTIRLPARDLSPTRDSPVQTTSRETVFIPHEETRNQKRGRKRTELRLKQRLDNRGAPKEPNQSQIYRQARHAEKIAKKEKRTADIAAKEAANLPRQQAAQDTQRQQARNAIKQAKAAEHAKAEAVRKAKFHVENMEMGFDHAPRGNGLGLKEVPGSATPGSRLTRRCQIMSLGSEMESVSLAETDSDGDVRDMMRLDL